MTNDFHRYSKYMPAVLAVTLLSLLAACVAKPGMHDAANQPTVYSTYINARFGYSICYPSDELIPQGEPENGDGQTFLSKDGRATVWVYGAYNVLNDTLSGIQQSEIERFKGSDSSFKTLEAQVSATTSTLEGASAAQDYYEKVMFSGGTIFTFIAQYPHAEVSTFEPITSHMADCFIVLSQTK